MNRRDFLRLGGAGLAGAVLLGTAGGKVLARTGPSLRSEFESAARRYKVPLELLLAIGYVNTLWEMPPPEASPYEKGDLHGRGAYGIMQLLRNPSRDTLGRAAKLTGFSEEGLKNERDANVRGGAAVLADMQGKTKPKDLNGWQEAVAEYGDTDLYAVEIYETLKSGASETISTGENLGFEPQNVEVPRIFTTQASADYPGATYRPAYYRNYTASRRESTYNIDKIIVHVAQGSYAGTVSWFQNSAAGVSAHYTVGQRAQVAQSVRHKDIAYHAGYWPYNTTSIGIEHEGYISNPRYFTKAMYRASARLSAYVCKRHNIPVNRSHIIGHYEVPGCSGVGGGASCHRDPGRYWNWTKYMTLIRAYL